MTNKTELLPCPFCGAQGIPQMSNRLIYAFVDHDDFCPMSGSMPTLEKWNTRAPAEDVRAVGEEPAAWLVNGVPFTDAQSAQAFLGFSNYEVIPLYRHPQRPVVLPEPEPVSYTCIGKGGRYEILGLATGAGLTRGEDRLVYRDISTSRLFLRTEADFSQRMERLNKC